MSNTISDYIERDLRARLACQGEFECPLTLHALSRHYSVSLTPVREAVRRLLEARVLLKQPNGRLIVDAVFASKKRPASTSVAAPPQRPADIEKRLVLEIVEKSLRRDSEFLREDAAARRFGVGRTAIRQLLSRLAGRGLLVHVPRRGWSVRPFDNDDLAAYIETREVLELKALELARPRLDKKILRGMLAANTKHIGRQQLDNSIHGYIVQASENRYIRDFFEHYGDYYDTIFGYAAPETSVVASMARQHRAILRALIAEDWSTARRALSQHIRAQRAIVQQLLAHLSRSDSNHEAAS
ncbi:MAG: GntR family transcriptional regulator [Planctomycetota bacterium]|nr:GntR family transcriptional regulator [Planctomycetota bacterium]